MYHLLKHFQIKVKLVIFYIVVVNKSYEKAKTNNDCAAKA